MRKYAELVGLCGTCPIMRKVTNYAQNYARAQSHNSTIPTLLCLCSTQFICRADGIVCFGLSVHLCLCVYVCTWVDAFSHRFAVNF